ncbi:hypothetical protein MNBD_GAMMA16-580 [hydrothermal vent metagenome]|uniref:Uncharacterized protein n=1 Tax=hydrothermal vent metagenome TaxID=652676 RepID=A0A3B0ZI56_9ZZZZ
MKNLTRRKFLSQLFFSIFSLVGISSLVFSKNKVRIIEVQSVKGKNPLILNECVIVYKEWINKEEITPSYYIDSIMKKYQLDPRKISDAVKLDFQQNNFFEVNGLQLSKTEAAFLALMGSSSTT